MVWYVGFELATSRFHVHHPNHDTTGSPEGLRNMEETQSVAIANDIHKTNLPKTHQSMKHGRTAKAEVAMGWMYLCWWRTHQLNPCSPGCTPWRLVLVIVRDLAVIAYRSWVEDLRWWRSLSDNRLSLEGWTPLGRLIPTHGLQGLSHCWQYNISRLCDQLGFFPVGRLPAVYWLGFWTEGWEVAGLKPACCTSRNHRQSKTYSNYSVGHKRTPTSVKKL